MPHTTVWWYKNYSSSILLE